MRRIIFCKSPLKKTRLSPLATNRVLHHAIRPEKRVPETGRFSGSYPAIPFELRDNNQPKTQIVVAVVGVVVVAIRGAAVLSVVVPTAAAIHAVGAL